VLLFWLFIGGVVAVVLAVLLYAALTVERDPAHSHRPPTAVEKFWRGVRRLVPCRAASERQRARRESRRRAWAARRTRALGMLGHRPRPQETSSALVTAAPEPADELAEPPEDPDWAARLRDQIRTEPEPAEAAPDPDPNAHLRRYWPEQTGEWRADMMTRMRDARQLPPDQAEPADRTEAWLARTEETGDPDAFMGREKNRDS